MEKCKKCVCQYCSKLACSEFRFCHPYQKCRRCQMENMSPIYSCENFTKPKRVESVIVKQKKYPPIQEMLDQILTKLTNIEEKMSEK